MTIMTSEIDNMFDAFKTVSAQLKLQGEALESVKNLLQDLTVDLQELKEDWRVLLQKVEVYKKIMLYMLKKFNLKLMVIFIDGLLNI